MTPTEVSDLVSRITDDLKTVVADEIELAKAELRPTVRKAGVGSGLFAGALWFVISATVVLWFVISAAFSWLYASTTNLSPFATVFFGNLTSFGMILVIAAVFVVFGVKSFKGIKGFRKTPQAMTAAVKALSAGFADGTTKVTEELDEAAERRQRARDERAAARAAKQSRQL